MANIRFKYGCIGMGQSPTRNHKDEWLKIKPNRIYLDVGNRICSGVIDHHHPYLPETSKECMSTASLLLKHKRYVLNQINTEGMTGEEPVELIVHSSPDLDCLASAYLVEELLMTGSYPLGAEKLAKYLDKCDSGRLLIDNNSLRSLLGISYVIREVLWAKEMGIIPDDIDPLASREEWGRLWAIICEFDSKGEIKISNEKWISRGIELVRYCMTNLQQMLEQDPDADLHDIDIIGEDNPFAWEITFLLSDYTRYERDLEKHCEMRQLFLPNKIHGRELILVDALFWNEPPSCILHKHWARQDKRASLGEGYVLTFIPYHRVVIDASETGVNVKCTHRVVISTNPDKTVNLKGLGEALERAEIQKEQEIFCYDTIMINRWRDRLQKRPGYENEEWCTNENPWFDGRGTHNYTIVDAPSRFVHGIQLKGVAGGSLLSESEIKQITLRYLKPGAQQNFIRFIFPFDFAAENFTNIAIAIKKISSPSLPQCTGNSTSYSLEECILPDDVQFSREYKEYFLPYIQEYLFSNPSNVGKDVDDVYIRLDYKNSAVLNLAQSGDNGQEKSNALSSSINAHFYNSHIAMFRYGVGLLTVDCHINMTEGQLCFDDILIFNRTIRESALNEIRRLNETKKLCGGRDISVLTPLFKELHRVADKINDELSDDYSEIFTIVPQQCLVFAGIEVKSKDYYRMKSTELVYQLCNFLEPNQQIGDSEFIKRVLKDTYLELQENAICGFTKNGGCLIAVSNVSRGENFYRSGKDLAEVWNGFPTTDFYIFLLALHQRLVLLKLSHEFAHCSNSRSSIQTSNLRERLLDFTKRSYFSQITNDEIGMEFYRRWRTILDIDQLYDEVSKQISTVDDFERAQINSFAQKASMVVLPAVVFAGIFGMNFNEMSIPFFPEKMSDFIKGNEFINEIIKSFQPYYGGYLYALLLFIGGIFYRRFKTPRQKLGRYLRKKGNQIINVNKKPTIKG